MTGFRFIFDDDDEGFELVEEEAETPTNLEDGEEEKSSQITEEEVIWETEED